MDLAKIYGFFIEAILFRPVDRHLPSVILLGLQSTLADKKKGKERIEEDKWRTTPKVLSGDGTLLGLVQFGED